MNLKDVYVKLNEINTTVESESIKNLLSEIKQEILLEESKKQGSRITRNKKCISIIAKSKLPNPLFHKCCYQDGHQVVTDSYIGCILKKEDEIIGLEEASEKDNYPIMKKILCKSLELFYEDVQVSINEIKTLAKIKAPTVQIGVAYFDPKKLLDLFYLLNIDNQETTILQVAHPLKPAFIIKDNGSIGCICPIKVNN